MDIVAENQPRVVSEKQAIEEIMPPGICREIKPVSFRKCRQSAGRGYRLNSKRAGRTWDGLLQKLEDKKAASAKGSSQSGQHQAHGFDRRAFPRHSSDALVLAFNQDQAGHTEAGKKGYAINVSQNGISFAARSPFQLREQLQLRVEEALLNFALDVSAEVLRCESLDNEFWRVDCKLVSPLTSQQIVLLKEHVPSCFAG
jgi:hypothetical protein